ncbi:carbohydrate ABC transporter permease [Paenibacillus koleovorans]|uniref:carbohydrate ABC transporter permease n=1 Tax=Paenibacillus koleovorans TaxID=121608 RepID=UPI000FDB3787|nr:carbohydrate ABC transporter permease [Paenibacillus koleovorans]
MRMNKLLVLIIHVLLALVALIWIYPLIWMMFSSLKTDSEFLTGGLQLLPDIPQWANYKRAWEVAHFNVYFMNSVTLSVSVVVVVVIVSSLMGYSLGRVQFPGRKFLMGLFVFTLFVPKGYTILPVYLFIKWIGLLNTMAGLILVESSGTHIVFILLFAAYFAAIPKELEDSAEMDGCGFIKTYYKVMLPLAMPIIATVAIVQFINAWNSFFVPLIFTLGSPNLKTLSVGMYNFSNHLTTDYPGIAAAASIALIPVLTIFVFFQRYFIEGISGAVKG